MYSFSQLKELESRVVTQLAAVQNQMEQAKNAFAAAEASLAQMGATYGEWATQVDVLAAANPSDAGVAVLKATKDRIVAEFGAATGKATELKDAVSGK